MLFCFGGGSVGGCYARVRVICKCVRSSINAENQLNGIYRKRKPYNRAFITNIYADGICGVNIREKGPLYGFCIFLEFFIKNSFTLLNFNSLLSADDINVLEAI